MWIHSYLHALQTTPMCTVQYSSNNQFMLGSVNSIQFNSVYSHFFENINIIYSIKERIQ